MRVQQNSLNPPDQERDSSARCGKFPGNLRSQWAEDKKPNRSLVLGLFEVSFAAKTTFASGSSNWPSISRSTMSDAFQFRIERLDKISIGQSDVQELFRA
ncbi:hypothetical protein C1J03_09765 [Sulfitobacter sp. SK012]|nr:hypothetical protein C1J03_09765 [Sulfitobacter sp. SK012]